MPVQGSFGVWPWEQMKQLVALDGCGYHEDVKKGIGLFSEAAREAPTPCQGKVLRGCLSFLVVV